MAMMLKETGRVGKSGVFTIPTALRKRFDLQDGSMLIAEECEDGIFLRPADAGPSDVPQRTLIGTPGSSLLKFVGTISKDDGKLRIEAIEEGCEKIDANGW